MPILTTTGEYSLVDAVTPSSSPVTVGVLLLDPESNQLHLRFRRDWPELFDDPHDIEYFAALEEDLRGKAAEWGGVELLKRLEDSLSNAVLISDRESILVGNWNSSLRQLYGKHVSPRVLPFRTHLPLYSVRAAAGKYGDRMEVEPEGWEEAPAGMRLTEDMFVAHVVGHSMEPRIPDGSLCIFRADVAGSRQGRLVLVENHGETGENRYTVKRYRSIKSADGESWRHDRIILEPLNREYDAWDLDPADTRIRVLAEFVAVLE